MALAQASGDDDDAAIGLRKVMHDTYCTVTHDVMYGVT
jgi:hypothetical protein